MHVYLIYNFQVNRIILNDVFDLELIFNQYLVISTFYHFGSTILSSRYFLRLDWHIFNDREARRIIIKTVQLKEDFQVEKSHYGKI